MEKLDVIAALAALAQENRLDLFRLLVRAGDDGLPAGAIAEALAIPNNTLSFHLDRLKNAGLVLHQRNGRNIIYAANYAAMDDVIGFLTANCCAGVSKAPRPATGSKPQNSKQKLSKPRVKPAAV